MSANEMKLLSGNAHRAFAEEISEYLDIPITPAEVSSFPNGETSVQIHENIRGKEVFIIQPTCPPTNQNLMELMILVDAAKRASSSRITAVLPFFGYARQDRKDKPRVPITAKLVANLLTSAGIDRLLTVDLHAPQIGGFFDIPVDHLHAAPVLVSHLREQDLDTSNLIVVSPDVGGSKLARTFSDILETPLAIVAKHRVNATQVSAEHVIADVEGKDVFIVDDMTESAGTLIAAAKALKAHGAKKVFAGVTHALLSDLGRERLEFSDIDRLICTNSTPLAEGPKVEAVSIAPLVAESISRIYEGKSVSSLFDIDGKKV